MLRGRFVDLFLAREQELPRAEEKRPADEDRRSDQGDDRGDAWRGDGDERASEDERRDENVEARLEAFLEKNIVDDRAANSLRECTVEVKRKVLASGDLVSARNPSSALLARIRDASTPVPGREATPEEVQAFLDENPVDDAAADKLRTAEPWVQRI